MAQIAIAQNNGKFSSRILVLICCRLHASCISTLVLIISARQGSVLAMAVTRVHITEDVYLSLELSCLDRRNIYNECIISLV